MNIRFDSYRADDDTHNQDVEGLDLPALTLHWTVTTEHDRDHAGPYTVRTAILTGATWGGLNLTVAQVTLAIDPREVERLRRIVEEGE